MTTDTKATYYDLDINGATIETRDIVRAVLERAGLGADASHQLGKLLERAIRLGAKPGTDVPREAEKIAIEAGMLRDAVASPAAEPITDDDAEDACRAFSEQTAKHLGAVNDLYALLNEARARIAELEHARDAWKRNSERWRQEAAEQSARTMAAERERDEWRQVADDLDKTVHELTDRYRPRRQSEEPAPDGVRVMVWSNDDSPRWMWRDGQYVNANETWTHQPPAPERKGE